MIKTISTPLLILLASVFAMTPFAIDSYLPAIPSIANELGVETSFVAVTVSLYILGLAIGQLIGGPLSDNYGRMKIMVIGLLIFALGSFLIATIGSLHMLWIWRMLQALGAGIAVVGVPATIRDNAEGKEAAKLFALIALIMMIAPSIAPALGTLIMNVLNWRWIFILLAIIATITALCTVFIMPKSDKRNKNKEKSGYLNVIKEHRALGYLVAQACSYTMLVVFITNAPFAYIEYFSVDETLFSALLLINVIGLVVINRLNSFLLHRFTPDALLKGFLIMQLFGGITLVINLYFAPHDIYFIVPGFVICIASIGGILANSNACFMNYFKENAGVAAALLGASQYALGAGVSALVAMLSLHSLWPMVLTMLLATLVALIGAHYSSHYEQKPN
ncbi:major facilitator superfamily permease [Psychromonas sp. CNPT3]|uniref:multidrug effflux MFS transporter n=1 Tax=Psychromonas sp. CNPT3 TaxID=314282 RepID=UPI00006E9E72|nr:multidrug effflux MFS transporter [Psychromonas sp. CNPT3]AGH80285.1 major facilitator superfamily permease [Psychromonas sp. CNPT3]